MISERDREEPSRIDDLLPATLEGVAQRLLESNTFEELVYRESEMDALFTLVDIAIKTARTANRAGGATVTSRQSAPDLYRLRDLIFEAHDMTHDDRTEEASRLLVEAAKIASSWS